MSYVLKIIDGRLTEERKMIRIDVGKYFNRAELNLIYVRTIDNVVYQVKQQSKRIWIIPNKLTFWRSDRGYFWSLLSDNGSNLTVGRMIDYELILDFDTLRYDRVFTDTCHKLPEQMGRTEAFHIRTLIIETIERGEEQVKKSELNLLSKRFNVLVANADSKAISDFQQYLMDSDVITLSEVSTTSDVLVKSIATNPTKVVKFASPTGQWYAIHMSDRLVVFYFTTKGALKAILFNIDASAGMTYYIPTRDNQFDILGAMGVYFNKRHFSRTSVIKESSMSVTQLRHEVRELEQAVIDINRRQKTIVDRLLRLEI